MPRFEPCPSCRRHIACSERACPFCGEATPSDFASAPAPRPPAATSRAAIVFLGAAVAATSTACTKSAEERATPQDAGSTSSGAMTAVPPYGVFPDPRPVSATDWPEAPADAGAREEAGRADASAETTKQEPRRAVPPYGVFPDPKRKRAADKTSCDPPFRIDAQGRKIYKPECM